MDITIINAHENDINQLIRMNRHLMEDERFDRTPDDDNLLSRWSLFLDDPKYKSFLFKNGTEIIGYAVVQVDISPVYLRHFFISRTHRRSGYGTRCFNKLLDTLGTHQVDLDVMSCNESGMKFWESLGFTERCRLMTMDRSVN